MRMKDVARVELGAQNYSQIGRLNGKPAAIIAIYQLPGSNAIDTMNRAKQLMEELKKRFPQDLDYMISLDTTLAVRRASMRSSKRCSKRSSWSSSSSTSSCRAGARR